METGSNVAASPITFRPGVGSSYGNGWRQLWRYFPFLLLIGIIYVVISNAITVVQWIAQLSSEIGDISAGLTGLILSIISIAFGLLIINPIGYGQNYAYLKAARDDKVDIQDIFAAFQNYWNAVAASLLVAIIVGIGFILLIVPGIIFACKLAFVPYLVVDRKLSVMKAIDTSWNMTNGQSWRVFLIYLLGIPIVIAGLICLVVGVIISIMWINAALASLYHAVSTSSAAAVEQPSPIK